MIDREKYISDILHYQGIHLLKLITGIRRCGKSTVLEMIRDELNRRRGGDEAAILYMNFELLEFQHIVDDNGLREHLRQLDYRKFQHIFFDEIQNVKAWEKVVNGLHAEKRFDIYVTGSNSTLLSGELATRIAGRYVQFRIQTLSFNEFAAFKGGDAKQGRDVSARALFEQYLELGGFPIVAAAGTTPEQSRRLVEDIYNSVVLKDVIARNKIRAPDKLDRLARFVAMNVGNRFSAQSIVNYVKSQSRSMDIDTAYAFLRGLEESCVITKVPRYDVKGKEVLKTQEKYYLADHSLLSALTGSTAGYVGGMLENIVHQELTHRGWRVYVGNGSESEIDFVALKSGETAFIQVAYKLDSPRTVEREFRALAKIPESGEKIVLTMEEKFKSPLSGVRAMYLPEWLLKKEKTGG